MHTLSDGTEAILLPEKSEIKHLIEGGRTDHIHIVMELPFKPDVKVGASYYVGVIVDETFEPYGLQIKMTCDDLEGTVAYFQTNKPDETVYELFLEEE